jgi:hypothetical protein
MSEAHRTESISSVLLTNSKEALMVRLHARLSERLSEPLLLSTVAFEFRSVPRSGLLLLLRALEDPLSAAQAAGRLALLDQAGQVLAQLRQDLAGGD